MTALKTLAASVALAAFSLTACSEAQPDGRTQFERETDRAKGSDTAPVTIIEYASVACGGCAQFHEMGMPAIDQYVESGDVRYVFREMITGNPNIAVAGFMLANCAPEEDYFEVIDILFEQQRALFTALQQGRAQAQFQTIAHSAGFSDEDYRACVTDSANLEAVQAANERAAEDGIISTPTFIINGVTIEPGTASGVDGQVYLANGDPLIDEQGAIPFSYERETFERIILYFKDRAEGRSPSGEDGGAG